jgi:hypothetical protein
MFWLKEEIGKNNNFSKRAKIKNQNNEDQIKKILWHQFEL